MRAPISLFILTFFTVPPAQASSFVYCQRLLENPKAHFSAAQAELINDFHLKRGRPAPLMKRNDVLSRVRANPKTPDMQSSAEDWVKYGAKIQINKSTYFDIVQTQFIKLLRQEGVIADQLHFSNPAAYHRVLSLFFDQRPETLIDEAMTQIAEFNPTQENREKLHGILAQLKLQKNQITVAPYEKIPELIKFPEDTTQAMRDFYAGIVSLWNDPVALLSKMRYVKHLVGDVNNAQGLETLRREIEKQGGFSEGPKFHRDILTSQDWGVFLQLGRPTAEPGGTHSFGSTLSTKSLPYESQHVHRNQWLLIMIELKLNPERFKTGKTISPVDAYRLLGSWGEVQGQHPDWSRETIPGLSDDLSAFANYWYRLFDYVPHYGQISNAANPFYFNELWVRETGFHTAW